MIKNPVTPELRPYSVLINVIRRVARCAVASNDVCVLCNRLERHEAVFAQHVRQRAVGTMWGFLGRCGRAACTL